MNKRNIAGMTLVETLVGVGVGSLLFLALGAVSMFGTRSFSSMAEYSDLNRTNRLALDQISREIRQSKGLSSYSSTPNADTLVFKRAADTFSLVYEKPTQLLKEVSSGNERVLLRNCTYFNAQFFKRTPVPKSFDFDLTTDWSEVKMVQLDWSCQRRVTYSQTNSGKVQSMKIVIRKRPD